MTDLRLETLGIDLTRPGFYDEPSFLIAEERDPTFLELYGSHVEALTLDDGYLQYARERVVATTDFMTARLSADGRKGVYADMSIVLGRFLERQGVWSYGCRGVLAVAFPPTSGLAPYFVRPHRGAEGHVWLRVPPYRVVDLTIGRQRYENGEERYVPDRIIEERARSEEPRVSDLLDDAAIRALRAELGREPCVGDIMKTEPETWAVRSNDVEVRYTKMTVTVFGGNFETATRLCLSGRFPKDLWEDFRRATNPPSGYAR